VNISEAKVPSYMWEHLRLWTRSPHL